MNKSLGALFAALTVGLPALALAQAAPTNTLAPRPVVTSVGSNDLIQIIPNGIPTAQSSFVKPGTLLSSGLAGGVNAQTGTTYTVLATDAGKLVTFSNVGAVAVTLPQAGTTGFESSRIFAFENKGSGTVTITPTTSTVNGAATLVLKQNRGAQLKSDGTNYQISEAAAGFLVTPATVPEGGTGLATGTSGGFPAFNAAGTMASTGAIAANHAVTGGGVGAVPIDSLVTITKPATGSTLTIVDGKTLTANNSLTLAGTDTTTMTFPTTSATIARTDAAQTFTGIQTLSGAILYTGVVTDATKTDATVCEDTTTHQLYFGSGASGICLGTSSLRFKRDVQPLQAGLPQVLAMRPISYRYKKGYGDDNNKRPLYGFAAEQMVQVMPQLVGLDAKGLPNSVDWAGVVPVLVRAIQDQQAEIDAIKHRVR